MTNGGPEFRPNTPNRVMPPRKWTRFKTHSFQHFIIAAGKEGMSRARVESEWLNRLPPSLRGRLTNSEWAHVKSWLASLGYYYNQRFFWIHPHFRNKEIPLQPLQHAGDNQRTVQHTIRGTQPDDVPTHLAPHAEVFAKPTEVQIASHTRADGKTVVKGHTRSLPTKTRAPIPTRLEPTIEEVIDEMEAEEAEHAFINPDDGRGNVKTVRITIPRGVKVMIHYD